MKSDRRSGISWSSGRPPGVHIWRSSDPVGAVWFSQLLFATRPPGSARPEKGVHDMSKQNGSPSKALELDDDGRTKICEISYKIQSATSYDCDTLRRWRKYCAPLGRPIQKARRWVKTKLGRRFLWLYLESDLDEIAKRRTASRSRGLERHEVAKRLGVSRVTVNRRGRWPQPNVA